MPIKNEKPVGGGRGYGYSDCPVRTTLSKELIKKNNNKPLRVVRHKTVEIYA